MNPNTSCILCATDFSPASHEAANVAAKISLGRSEKLRLMHVSEARSGEALNTARQRLDAEAERLRAAGADVQPLLVESSRPSEAVLEHISAELPSLVVVASGVKGPIDRWAVGSFSERVAEAAPVPTLVVRNPSVFQSWDWAKDRLTVLLALDLHATSDVVLRWAKEFRLTGPCDLVSCHVNHRAPTPEEAAVAPGRPVNPPELQRRLERELQKKVRDQLGDDVSPVIVRPYFGDPAPCLVEIAAETKVQLIAVGAHQRQGLSRLTQFSTSRELLHHSAANVVCVPLNVKFDPREAHLPEFRRVLVATDFSDMGNAAVPFACAACAIGGLVRIIHVAKPGTRAAKRNGAGAATELRKRLRGLIPNEIGARAQPPEVEVVESRDVAGELCEQAEQFGADLVCLASHGLGASRALHGSVTKAVLKKIRRPLLVIRRPDA